MNDLAAAITESVAADGQTPMTGPLNLNNNKIVNLSPATIAGNAVEYSQLIAATTGAVSITGGTINGTTIGATTASTGRFSTLEATGTSTFTGASTFTAASTFSAGTAAAPAITTTGDTNTGIFFPAADTIAFSEGGTESMRIDGSGNVLVGGTTSVFTSAGRGVVEVNGSSQALYGFTVGGVSKGYTYHTGTDMLLYNNANGFLSFGTNTAERMRIDSSGNLLVGTTTSNGRLTVTGVDATGSNFSLYCRNNTAAAFYVRNDGYINTGLLAVSPYNYSTTGRAAIIDVAGGFGYLASVRAAKANIQNLTNISWVYNLNPVEFNYRKKDKDNKFTEEFESEKYYGLVAEEVESVNKELCFYDADGTLRGVSYDKLTSILLKAIQELNAKVEAQAAEIALLKSK
jgi:hypothetical protein